jgi:cell division protein ZipA
LAAICVPLLLAIWWWGSRRSRQAPGNSELREPTLGTSVTPAHHPPAAAGEAAEPLTDREWGVPPFEPLHIRTGDFETLRVDDVPMSAHPDSLEETWDVEANADPIHAGPPADVAADGAPEPLRAFFEASNASDPVRAPAPAIPPEPASPTEFATPPERASAPQPEPAADRRPSREAGTIRPADPAASSVAIEGPNVSELQRIVSLRVCASGDGRWTGPQLLAALESHGMAHGRYQVFHRRHGDGRTVFCAASLVEPGTFNLARMPEQEFRGLSLFAVLPGPAEPLRALDAMLQTAVGLAMTLDGVVQDATGATLTPQRAEALREDVAHFQALLTP